VPYRGKRSAKYSKANSKRNRYLQKYFSAQNRPLEGRANVLAAGLERGYLEPRQHRLPETDTQLRDDALRLKCAPRASFV
jgi:hypothetical protein